MGEKRESIAKNRENFDSQLISSETVVETGMLMLLLAAWQVNLAFKSLLCSLSKVSVLLTTVVVTCSEETSHESSSRAFSRHQLTRGTGQPVIILMNRETEMS